MKGTILGGVAWALLSGTAQAHAFLLEAQPKVGATAKAAPTEIRLIFSDWTEPQKSSIALFDAAGHRLATGAAVPGPNDNSSTLIAPIKTALTPGTYVVRWVAICHGNHKTEGDFKFRVSGQ